jgi:hypothetical protein
VTNVSLTLLSGRASLSDVNRERAAGRRSDADNKLSLHSFFPLDWKKEIKVEGCFCRAQTEVNVRTRP